jgi:hypothetical protein
MVLHFHAHGAVVVILIAKTDTPHRVVKDRPKLRAICAPLDFDQEYA